MARGSAQSALSRVRAPAFKLRAPIVREPVLHRQIADALRLELCAPGRVSRDGVVWYSVDMAAYAGNAPGIRTARGCIAGVADIEILHRGAAYFLEIKADDGELSDAQRDFANAVLCAACCYGVARNVAEVLACLDRWGIPRAHRLHGS